MCYKVDLQKENEKKLKAKLAGDNIHPFIQKYFLDIESKEGAIKYWSAVKDLLMWLMDKGIIEKSSLSDITLDDFYYVESMDINSYLHQKEDSGELSPTTLQTRKMIFRSFWEYLVETNRCPVTHNIVTKVKYKGIVRSNLVKKCPTDEQIKKMEDKILRKNDVFLKTRNFSILELLKGSGIRKGELVGLNLSDLFLDAEIPYIKVIGKGVYREIEARVVYLTGSAVRSLKDWLNVRSEFLRERDAENVEAVYITKSTKRLTGREVGDMISSCSNGEVSPHMMRHWYATVISRENVILAQQQLGHKSINTTTNNYANGIYGAKDILANM